MSERAPVGLDVTKITFPTDRVTIGQLRSEQPGLFSDAAGLRESRVRELNVSATIDTEIRLVRSAFAKALNLPEPRPQESREERIVGLNQDYRRYGLSTGMQMTRQLVRDMETAARSQIHPHRGR